MTSCLMHIVALVFHVHTKRLGSDDLHKQKLSPQPHWPIYNIPTQGYTSVWVTVGIQMQNNPRNGTRKRRWRARRKERWWIRVCLLSNSYIMYRRLSPNGTIDFSSRKKNVSFLRRSESCVAYRHLIGTRSLRTTSYFNLGAFGNKCVMGVLPEGGPSTSRARAWILQTPIARSYTSNQWKEKVNYLPVCWRERKSEKRRGREL